MFDASIDQSLAWAQGQEAGPAPEELLASGHIMLPGDPGKWDMRQ